MKRRLAVIGLVVLAGCGGESPPPAGAPAAATADDPGRPISEAQALTLARLLQQNWQRRGATFTGELGVRGVRMALSGRVDFRSGRGTATLREPSAASRRYVWTRRAVYAQAGPGSDRYVVQAPNAEGDPVHSGIAMINLLSAETIDNTANLKDQGARFLRSEKLGNAEVDVYRYRADGATTYWVNRDDGLLHQLEAKFPDGDRLVLTLTAHKPVRVQLPSSRG